MTDATMIERLNAALGGRYAIERQLGEGGMATVYLADDLKHERKVALKVLKPELAAVVGAERFLAEIKTTANLQHPNILPLFDSGEAEGLVYYVMPYVEGESSCPWTRRCASRSTWPRRSRPHTSRASSTGTSSRRTFW
jgi:serine/threonine protein kinase